MFKIVRKLQTCLASAAAMWRGTTHTVWPHRYSSIELLNVTKLEPADVSIFTCE